MEMAEQRTALLELIDKIEHLGQFQDRIDFPSTIGQIWDVFLGDVRNLIEIEICALFLVDDATHEFILEYVFPDDRKKYVKKKPNIRLNAAFFPG
jgi:hypothetical protein